MIPTWPRAIQAIVPYALPQQLLGCYARTNALRDSILHFSRLFEHAVPQGVGTSIIFRLENNALNDPVSSIEFSELVTQSTRDFLCIRVALHAVSGVSPPLAGAIPPGGNVNAPKQKQGFFPATMSSNNALAKRALENRDRFPTVQMEISAINGSTTATVFPRGVEGTVAHPGGPLLYGMSISYFLWTGIWAWPPV